MAKINSTTEVKIDNPFDGANDTKAVWAQLRSNKTPITKEELYKEVIDKRNTFLTELQNTSTTKK